MNYDFDIDIGFCDYILYSWMKLVLLLFRVWLCWLVYGFWFIGLNSDNLLFY